MTDVVTFASNPNLVASSDPEWNSTFALWLRRQALSHAHEKFGPMSVAVADSREVEYMLEQKYGRAWRSIPEAMEAYRPVSDRESAQDEIIARDFCAPQTDAAIALALHPAPNLAAALFKIEMIKIEELYNYTPMPRDPWEIVTEDMARLQGETK